jgi:hypothetical protein
MLADSAEHPEPSETTPHAWRRYADASGHAALWRGRFSRGTRPGRRGPRGYGRRHCRRRASRNR